MRQALFITYLILFTCVLLSCENDIGKVNQITSDVELPMQTAKNIEILYSDSAVLKVKLKSPLLNQFAGKDPYEEFPEGVDITFYNDSSKNNSHLTSKYAIRKKDGKLMEAKKDVIVVNEKGEQLNTEHLIWDEEHKKIYTPAFVKITTADEILYGDGLESNQNFTKYKILNIKGTINLKDQANGKDG